MTRAPKKCVDCRTPSAKSICPGCRETRRMLTALLDPRPASQAERERAAERERRLRTRGEMAPRDVA